MIVDSHTHISERWHRGAEYASQISGAWGSTIFASADEHYAMSSEVDKVIVLAFKAVARQSHIPNEYIADYVKRDPGRLIGYASADPNEATALDEIKHAVLNLGLKGIKFSPTYQVFDPRDEGKVYPIYEFAQAHGVPILLHMGSPIIPNAAFDVADPLIMDPVARDFPELKIVLAHLGAPWHEHTIRLLRKHRHVYADISGLARAPWVVYTGLIHAREYGQLDKLLFGTDFPVTTPAKYLQILRNLGRTLQDEYGLAKEPPWLAEVMESIIHGDTLGKLGIA